MNVLVFNLKTDADDPVLGFATDWLYSLSGKVANLTVITMCAGRYDLPPNVRVYSVGKEKGYSEVRRVLEFYRHLFRVLMTQQIDVCFAHMIPIFAILAWPFLKCKRIPISLWYSHRQVSAQLRVAHRLCNRIFTSTKAAFQIPSAKVRYLGHGISETKFARNTCGGATKDGAKLIYVGRISRIKGVHVMVEAMAELAKDTEPFRLDLIGEPLTSDDVQYLTELKQAISKYRLNQCVRFLGAMPHAEVASHICEAQVSLNLCPNGSLDKAVLESLMLGVPAIVFNESYGPCYKEAGLDPSHYIVSELSGARVAEAVRRWSAENEDFKRQAATAVSAVVARNHGLNRLTTLLTAELGKI